MEKALNFKDIILKHEECVVNSRKECDVSSLIAGQIIETPVVPANMPAILNLDIAEAFDKSNWFHVYHRLGGNEDIKNYIKKANLEEWNFVSISIGVKTEDFELIQWISETGYRVNSITVDVALSWQENVAKICTFIRKKMPYVYLIVGNGDNPKWIKWLQRLGVNCAKINIGVSSACRTKEYTGFGSTTVTDLEKCAEVKGQMKIMSDGGLTRLSDGDIAIGDVAKAIRFGADYVMSGAIFSQCIDSPALINRYYGNSTARAKGHSNNVEGAEITVQTNGRTMIQQMKLIKESLQSSVSYAGGKDLSALTSVNFQIV